jgi:hypothetical protein
VLDPRARVRALAAMAGVAPDALDFALHDSRARSPHELRDTLALLETVRRALIRRKHEAGLTASAKATASLAEAERRRKTGGYERTPHGIS